VKLGSRIERGQALFTLFSEDEALLEEPEQMLRAALSIGQTPPKLLPLVREVVSTESIQRQK
jgi:pyrimidine-nucleoside phosphorylase